MVASSPFFSDETATDVAYVNVRAAKNAYALSARQNCEELWEIFEPYADAEFLKEIRSNFNARYWEMYLTAFFVREGYEVRAPKPGPDIGIEVEGHRIWFEAACPERGAEGTPDQVPEIRATAIGERPIVYDVPKERMVLRYLNSISEKQRQHTSWLTAGIVAPEDALVIAINPRRLQHEFSDADPPRILRAAFTVGSPYIAIDPNTLKAVEVGYQFRDKIEKSSGAKVSTGVFLLDEYAGVSALLCSRIDVANQPEKMGADFQLVPNPKANSPLPEQFRLKGTYFRVEHSADSYTVTPETAA